jgi:hypothetical protein
VFCLRLVIIVLNCDLADYMTGYDKFNHSKSFNHFDHSLDNNPNEKKTY